MELSDLSDDELIRQSVERPWDDGGKEAFWEVWRRHESWVAQRVGARRGFAPKGSNQQAFCEQVQEQVMENFRRGLPQYRKAGSVRSFLSRIIDWAAIDEYRHQKRRPILVDPQAALGFNPDTSLAEEEALGLVAYRAGMFFPAPSRVLEAKDRLEKILVMLELMATESKHGPKWAKALRWYYMENRTQRAIAEILGVDERTVARWLDDGREAAKRIMKERFNLTSLEDL